MMILPKQQFAHWVIIKLLNRSGVWETFLAGTQGNYTTAFTSETVTYYIPALDDFFPLERAHVLFTVNFKNLKTSTHGTT